MGSMVAIAMPNSRLRQFDDKPARPPPEVLAMLQETRYPAFP